MRLKSIERRRRRMPSAELCRMTKTEPKTEARDDDRDMLVAKM
jgi:hypothetical protein